MGVHVASHGAAVSVSTTAPSTRKSTALTVPSESVASAARATGSPVVTWVLSSGAVTVTVGGSLTRLPSSGTIGAALSKK